MRVLTVRVLVQRRAYSKTNTGSVTIGGVRVTVPTPSHPHLVPRNYVTGQLAQSSLSHMRWMLQKDSLGQDMFLLGAPGHSRRTLVLQWLELTNREYEYLSITRDTTEADIKQRREIRQGSAFYEDLPAVRAALQGRVLILDGVEKAERNVLPILNNLLENREMQLDDGRFLLAADKYDKLAAIHSIEQLTDWQLERVNERFRVIALGVPVPKYRGHSLDPPFRSRFQCRTVEAAPFKDMHSIVTALAPQIDNDRVMSLLSFAYGTNADALGELGVPPMCIEHLPAAAALWGCGKTAVVHEFAAMAGYGPEQMDTFMLYQDMSSRDLLQQRRMLPTGDTVWQDTPLVTAARRGHLLVMDGLHRLHHSTATALHRLIQDRELELFDGSRLIGQTRYESLKQHTALSDAQMAERGVHPIHPGFRLLGLAEPPNTQDGAAGKQWLSAELLALWPHLSLTPLTAHDEANVLAKLVPGLDSKRQRQLSELAHTLQHSADTSLSELSSCVSTRQMVRIMRRLAAHPNECLHTSFTGACLHKLEPFPFGFGLADWFLPSTVRTALDGALKTAGITPITDNAALQSQPIECVIEAPDRLRIGHTTAVRHEASNSTLVPDILYYDNVQHNQILESMLKDWLLGEHLLLIGNQGVGKNKVADRFLQLMNRPRQYIQLHRDTTVQTLTLQATVVGGVVVYEDSPLVKAVKRGQVLVVDEGDKASTHVTCILKSLLESSRMHMADGRRIVPASAANALDTDPDLIRMHPDFRVIVLANRPGYPFLGNDFFASLGDQFACHVVDNPAADSELSMLRSYAPDVPEQTLQKLVSAFSELRGLADQALLAYPYSSRELVNIAKHLQKYPDDGLPAVLNNVFHFDSFTKEATETVTQIMRRHGVPFGVGAGSSQPVLKLAHSVDLPAPEPMFSWRLNAQTVDADLKLLDVDLKPINLSSAYKVPSNEHKLATADARAQVFSEQIAHWQLPFTQAFVLSDLLSHDGKAVVAVSNPLCIFQAPLHVSADRTLQTDVGGLFPSVRGVFKPRLKVAALPANGQFNEHLLLHEEMTNKMLLVGGPNMREAYEVRTGGLLANTVTKWTKQPYAHEKTHWRMVPQLSAAEGKVLLYERNGHSIVLLDWVSGLQAQTRLPDHLSVRNVHLMNTNTAILHTQHGMHVLRMESNESNRALWTIQNIHQSDESMSIACASAMQLSKELAKAFAGSEQSQAHLMMPLSTQFMTGLAQLPLIKDTPVLGHRANVNEPMAPMQRPDWMSATSAYWHDARQQNILLAQTAQSVTALPPWMLPASALDKDTDLSGVCGYLRVSDWVHGKQSYVPVPAPKLPCHYSSWLSTIMHTRMLLTEHAGNSVVTCDTAGGIRHWETDLTRLANSEKAWRRMFGVEGAEQGELGLEVDRPDFDLSKLTSPMHGVTDPTGAPHHGGAMFAGGTGGYNSAGLGGVGGPYRLDLGHDIHQLSDEAKAAVPEEIKAKAREIAKRAFAQRLKEIKMSEFEADTYQDLYSRIEKHVTRLKLMLDGLQQRSKERQWQRHQTFGDVDESKLIEGVTGERGIYRRRVDKEPEPGTPAEKPKRLRLCVDVSASMYRFNGYDQRLQRTLESSLMIMEALHNQAHAIKYDIIGHSGDEPDMQFVHVDKPPDNQKLRLDVLKQMMACAQFCMSGDHTLECAKLSVTQLAHEDADERIVIVLSDANLYRYGIKPSRFAEIMSSDNRVQVFAIFIGSLGEQAKDMKQQLPAGKAYICEQTSDIPHILQQIFNSTVFSDVNE